MTNWEYRTEQFDVKGFWGGELEVSEFQHRLNNLGKEGWELVNCFDTNMVQGQTRYIIAVFKRAL